MTVTFGYSFNMFFVTDLVEGIILVLAYLMFIFSSRNQPRENKSYQLLRNAGIIGIIFSLLAIAFPQTYCLSCTPSEIFVTNVYGFTIALISFIPMLVCFGVFLFVLGKRNKETYGQILIASGILWILAFFGYVTTLFYIVFNSISIFFYIGILSYLAIPAVLLMIVHGAKFRDRYLALAGIFYIISWLAVVFVPWLPFPPI